MGIAHIIGGVFAAFFASIGGFTTGPITKFDVCITTL
jgi:hypothetical protein